ncbi:MAG: GTP-binding protein, partial [Spirochaetota bacterium]
TQTINFFVVNEAISFADLPGFGFAEAPGEIKKTFMPMITEYITKRENLRVVFVLVDARRTPGDFEKDIISRLAGRSIPTAVIATKTDKLSANQLAGRLREIADELEIKREDIFSTSSLKKTGKKEIMKLITQFADR